MAIPIQKLIFDLSEIVQAENDENLFVCGIESDTEDEAADDNGVDDGAGAIGVNYDIAPPPVDLFYNTLEDALRSIRGFAKPVEYQRHKMP